MKIGALLTLILLPLGLLAQESKTPVAGLAIVNSCSAGVVRYKESKADDRALVVTNGHCLLLNMTFGRPLPYPLAGEILRNVTEPRFLNATSIHLHAKTRTIQAKALRLVYATMSGTDVALFELPHTYAQLRAWGVPAFTIATRAPWPGEKVEIRSGFYARRFTCRFESLRTVLEGPFFTTNALMFSKECAVYPGYSGSLILSQRTGEVLGLANTHSSEGPTTCGFDHPCFFALESKRISAVGSYRTFGVPLTNLPQESATINLFAPALSFEASTMQARLDRFAKFARPLLSATGVQLEVALDREWAELPGHSAFNRGTLTITIGARLYENPRMTADALDVILCHELGHLMGHPPKKTNAMNNSGDWASGEGESDYFAGSCLMNLWKNELNSALVFNAWDTEERCEGLQSIVQRQLCERAAQAGLDLFRMFYDVYAMSGSAQGPRPDIHAHDSNEVSEYLFGYPSYQCRLETVMAGALQQERPRCWFYK